jgi:copper chaperone CopZ
MPKSTFEVLNVKCGGCASTLKKKLQPVFGEVEVNLDVMPRKITLDITQEDISSLAEELKSLGYPLVGEDMSSFEEYKAKAKSFISCAVGKMDT